MGVDCFYKSSKAQVKCVQATLGSILFSHLSLSNPSTQPDTLPEKRQLLACAKNEGHGSDEAQTKHLEAKNGLVQRLQAHTLLLKLVSVLRLIYLQLKGGKCFVDGYREMIMLSRALQYRGGIVRKAATHGKEVVKECQEPPGDVDSDGKRE